MDAYVLSHQCITTDENLRGTGLIQMTRRSNPEVGWKNDLSLASRANYDLAFKQRFTV
jgi:hypothetical protein